MTEKSEVADLLVVGGGINGAGIACDAAGRGLSVVLCEQDDLASATSSASSKMIHGGLRYLEYYEFRLVRESLKERDVLLAKAPHIIWPLRFVLPHRNAVRPAWMIRAGLFLYDHLGGRTRLPGSTGINLARAAAGAPLTDDIAKGFVYSDCWVDDARLVVLNAMSAAANGARVLTRTRLTSARREDGAWQAQLHDRDGGGPRTVCARALVNAAGPWVEDVLGRAGGAAANTTRIRLVKGSHIVVPRLYDGDHGYILQNTDRRVVFVIPYEGRFSLIGTTEVPADGDPVAAPVSEHEISYLCETVGAYFTKPIAAADVVWSYAGVRPLFDDESSDASAVTRDYVLELDSTGGPPLLSVFGGKITTYRCLAEHAMEKLAPHFPGMGAPWTATAPLPGGDMADADFTAFVADLGTRYGAIDADYLGALARRHGTLTARVLGDARTPGDLGQDLGGGLTAREVDYLVRHEWARSADDILWRRTKRGLHMSEAERQGVADYLARMRSGQSENTVSTPQP